MQITKRPTSITQQSKIDKSSRARLTRAERLFKVQLGVIAGKTNRAIAKVVGVDEGTVRRDKLTLALSKAEIIAVKAGAAVAPLLRKQQVQAAKDIRKKQEIAEQQSFAISTRLAEVISDWVRQFPLWPSQKLWVMREAERHSWHRHVMGDSCSVISKAESVIENSRPKTVEPSEAPQLMEWALGWLLTWILKLEPSREIRSRAFGRVLIGLERESPGW